MDHYQKLLAKYEQTKPFRGRKDDPVRPLETPIRRWQRNPDYTWENPQGASYGEYVDAGFRRKGRYAVALCPVTRDLTLYYWKRRAAVLHADGRVSVTSTSYGGDAMIHPWLPEGIRPSSPSAICFIGKEGEPMRFWGSDVGPYMRVVRLGWYGTATFKLDDEGLWQLDGDPSQEWTIERIDRAKARRVSQQHNLPDLVNWMRAYLALTDGSVESEGNDDHAAVVEALLRRDFVTAFHNLEPVQWRCFGSPLWRNNAKVTMRSVERARLRIYNDHGCVISETTPVVTLKDWYNRVRRNPCQAT